jgi:hypothetical protein
MKKSDSNAFVTQVLLYTLAMFCTSGSVGLGVVWLRHQISVTANRITQNEARARDIERRLYEIGTAIETEQGPEALKRRNEQWSLGLVPVREEQVSRVSQNVELRLAAKRNQGLFTDGATMVNFNLGAR